MDTTPFRKSSPSAPAGYFEWEAAGLRWLAAAGPAGEAARCALVIDVGPTHLDLERLTPAPPTPAAAEALGHRLAATHGAGAAAYGIGPEGWSGDGFLGPLDEPLPLHLPAVGSWAELWRDRILVETARARDRGVLGAGDVAVLERCAARVDEHDTGEPPARLHGDLWSGNVMWVRSDAGGTEAVLIDPAAHGGHRETDLAMLALFGAPHLERLLAAYDAARPLADGWRDRVALHQLHPVLLHAVLFGGGYAAQALQIARRYI